MKREERGANGKNVNENNANTSVYGWRQGIRINRKAAQP